MEEFVKEPGISVAFILSKPTGRKGTEKAGTFVAADEDRFDTGTRVDGATNEAVDKAYDDGGGGEIPGKRTSIIEKSEPLSHQCITRKVPWNTILVSQWMRKIRGICKIMGQG